jgi:hypothetical protein
MFEASSRTLSMSAAPKRDQNKVSTPPETPDRPSVSDAGEPRSMATPRGCAGPQHEHAGLALRDATIELAEYLCALIEQHHTAIFRINVMIYDAGHEARLRGVNGSLKGAGNDRAGTQQEITVLDERGSHRFNFRMTKLA